MAVSWMEEAKETAKKYADALKQQSQYLIDQQNQAKQNTLDAIENERLNAINNLNAGKDTIRQEALNNAKQANINRLLSLKDNQSAMSRAGLGTQGIVGSQVNSINNSYGTNLNSIIRDRTNQLQAVDDQVNNANIQYDTNRLNAINQYDSNIANLQNQIDTQALNQYNTVYAQLLAQKQQEWENQLAELQRQEAIRQYNANLALQQAQLEFEKQQAAQSQKNWEKEYALQKSQNYGFSNSSSSGSSSSSSKAANGRIIIANPYTGKVNPDAKYGVFSYNGTDSGYQPNNVGGKKLSKSGYTAGQIFDNSAYGSTGISLNNQSVWKTSDNKYYVWDGSINDYIDVTSKVNFRENYQGPMKW